MEARGIIQREGICLKHGVMSLPGVQVPPSVAKRKKKLTKKGSSELRNEARAPWTQTHHPEAPPPPRPTTDSGSPVQPAPVLGPPTAELKFYESTDHRLSDKVPASCCPQKAEGVRVLNSKPWLRSSEH